MALVVVLGRIRAGRDPSRGAIAAGSPPQANICRVLSASYPSPPDARSFHDHLRSWNPAPYDGLWSVPAGATDPADPGTWALSASPALAIEVTDGWTTSRPIKGTATDVDRVPEKDFVENALVAHALAEDLAAVCEAGTVRTAPPVRRPIPASSISSPRCARP